MLHTLTRCKFASGSIISDEIILLKIISILKEVFKASTNLIGFIDNVHICETVEVAFGIYFQSRVSEILRKCAEECLLLLVTVIFKR